MKINDRIRTPRFCTVTIVEVFESETAAWKVGYTESTDYDKDGYTIFGKALDGYHMVFAGVKKITNQSRAGAVIPRQKGKSVMEKNLHGLLMCFGDRYINTSDEQAEFDLKSNRDNMICAFNAILEYAGICAERRCSDE